MMTKLQASGFDMIRVGYTAPDLASLPLPHGGWGGWGLLRV